MSIIDMISADLALGEEDIRSIADDADSHYHKFVRGGRRIDAPDPQLKLLQYWIADFIRSETSAPLSYVTAYEVGCSIILNARQHCMNEHFLNMDIHHFFHSCTDKMVRDFFSSLKVKSSSRTHRLSDEEIDFLTAASTFQNHLTLGSPCSPAIANRIMRPIDEKIRSALSSGMVYTRYSDDISISSHTRINTYDITKSVQDTLNRYGFELNPKKTRCYGKGNNRSITGVFISQDGSLSLGKRRKHELESMLYKYLVKRDGKADIILGHINFCNSVDPAFTRKTLIKYGNYGLAQSYSSVIEALSMNLKGR